ncbi:hypothetical protein ACJJTC_012870 [Scirpophaga incertulas]
MLIKQFQVVTALFFILIGGLINVSLQSIAGITYMDDFDFESRYRNDHECDPFYWLPLHLPAHCLSIFERLIRKGIGKIGPVKIVRERYQPYDIQGEGTYDYMYRASYKDLSPYQKMIWRLGNDVAMMPTSPNITVIPGLGMVALYQQPVSRKNGDYIKKVAEKYKDKSFMFKPVQDLYKGNDESASKVRDHNLTNKNNDTLLNQMKSHKYNVKTKRFKNGELTVITLDNN